MPQRIHDRALYIKFSILALIIIVALIQSDASFLHYFEPFGPRKRQAVSCPPDRTTY